MALDPRLVALRARATRALGERQVKDALDLVRAIIGPQHIPDSEAAAQEALRLLQDGQAPSAEQLEALTIAVRLLRPVVFVRGGQLEPLPEAAPPRPALHTPEQTARWQSFSGKVAPVLFSIGRINAVRPTNGIVHIGTGFVVANGLLATNRHVLAALTSGSEALGPGMATVTFQQEDGVANPPEHVVAITGVRAVHPTLDMALFELADPARTAVELATTPASDGQPVVTIGFPANDRANNPLFLSGVFGNGFGVKRAALGEVMEGSGAPVLVHDCSTTQGNSGSPIFDLDTGHVVGIHRSGRFMYRNEAVDAAALGHFVTTHGT